MKALEGLETEEDFTTALFESKYDDVHRVAITKIGNQQTLVKVVSASRFSEDVTCEALSRISSQEFLTGIARSKTASERKASTAANNILDAQLLARCILETQHDSVAEKCIEKMADEQLLQNIVLASDLSKQRRLCALGKIKTQKTLGDIVVRCHDNWAYEHVLPRISDVDVITNLLVNASAADNLKMALLDKTEDGEILCKLVENRANVKQLRMKALSKAKTDGVFVRLLNVRPTLEEWVNAYAVDKTSDSKTLRMVTMSAEFSGKTRRSAFAKLKTQEDFMHIFSEAKDELAASLSFPLLEQKYFRSRAGQTSLLRCFRIVSQCELANAMFLKFEQETMSSLYRHADQVRIAKAVGTRPSAEVFSKGQEALFDSDVLLSMALGEFGENATLTQWVLSLNPDEDVLLEVALKAKDMVSRGQALSRIRSEERLCNVAKNSSNLALRLAAIERLTVYSEKVLKVLAYDKDMTVRTSAINKMKTLGSDKAAELEKTAKEEQRKVAEAKRKAYEEQVKLDAIEKKAFEDNVLRVAGTIQTNTMKKYLKLKEKANITSPCFTFSGRIGHVDGRNLILHVSTEDGEHRVKIELTGKCKLDLMTGDPVIITGYDDGSTYPEYRLCKGELREKGIGVN